LTIHTPRRTTAERAIAKIAQLSHDQQAKYIQALRDSIRWNPDDGNPPSSAGDVSIWNGIPIAALEKQLIVLNKVEAAELLTDVGVPYGLAKLRKDILTKQGYERKFNRPPAKVANRLVFTYAEVLSIVEFTGGMTVPDVLA
jgi:hypothetical protein